MCKFEKKKRLGSLEPNIQEMTVELTTVKMAKL